MFGSRALTTLEVNLALISMFPNTFDLLGRLSSGECATQSLGNPWICLSSMNIDMDTLRNKDKQKDNQEMYLTVSR